MIIEGKKVIKKYYTLLSSYDSNFDSESMIAESEPFDNIKECYLAYKEDKKINRDLHKSSSIQEPICYYRIRENLETDDSIYTSEYAIVHHKNGSVTLKRKDIY